MYRHVEKITKRLVLVCPKIQMFSTTPTIYLLTLQECVWTRIIKEEKQA